MSQHADLVLPLIAQAGHAGMTRGEIGTAIGDDLDHDALEELLGGLVEFGLLTVAKENGLQVFRASGNLPSRLPTTRPSTNIGSIDPVSPLYAGSKLNFAVRRLFATIVDVIAM